MMSQSMVVIGAPRTWVYSRRGCQLEAGRAGSQAVRRRGHRDRAGPPSGSDDHQRLSGDESYAVALKSLVVDLLAVVDAGNGCTTLDPQADEGLRVRHRESAPVHDGDGHEREVPAVGADPHAVRR